MVEAYLTFRSKSDGDRTNSPAILNALKYHPHIVIGDSNQKEAIGDNNRVLREEYLGVAFASVPDTVSIGEQVQVQMMLWQGSARRDFHSA
jgi:hypothetical protein